MEHPREVYFGHGHTIKCCTIVYWDSVVKQHGRYETGRPKWTMGSCSLLSGYICIEGGDIGTEIGVMCRLVSLLIHYFHY